MKRKLTRSHSLEMAAVGSASKRPKVSGVMAQFASKHSIVLNRFAKLREFVQAGVAGEGLISELRNALRQQKSKNKRRKREKLTLTARVDKVLSGKKVVGVPLSSASIQSFYEGLLSDSGRPERIGREQDLSERIDLFAESEIKQCLKHRPKGKACGIDRVSKSMLFAISRFPARFSYVHALLDSFLIRGVPACLKVALVTLVPKKAQASHPSEYRPISVTSLLYRLYSRLLSLRFYNAIDTQLSDSQGGYRVGTNGCARNLAVLRSLIGDAKVNSKLFSVASVDLSKAFDSVSHCAIRDTLAQLKMPEYLRRACLDTLDDNVLKFKGHKIEVKGAKGVPQGLPLSGYLFIATIDRIVKELDEMLPYQSATGAKFGSLCLVDDLLIFSRSQHDLQKKLVYLKESLRAGGWKLNSSKSYAYSQQRVQGSLKVAEGEIPIGEGESIRLIPASEKFRYLGLAISGTCALTDNFDSIFADLKETLKKITLGNLSVVEKVKAVKQIVIPRQLYRLNNLSSKSIHNSKYLKRTSTGERKRTNLTRVYEKLDRLIANALKTILRVPTRVDTSYFYVSEADGGLGLHRLEVLVPTMRIKSRDEMKVSRETLKLLDLYHFNDIDDCARLLEKHGLKVGELGRMQRNKAMIAGAQRTNTGKGLYYPTAKESVTPLIRRSNTTLGFTSYRLQRAVRFRLGCLPTRNRLHIMRRSDTNQCRHGCQAEETLAHLLNTKSCGSLHDFWVNRHNAICKYLFRVLLQIKRRGVHVFLEKRCGSNQPDLIIFDSRRAYLLEVGVSWAYGSSLKDRYDDKKRKYANEQVYNEVRRTLNETQESEGVRKVTVIPLIFGVHGSSYDPGGEFVDMVNRMTARKSLRNVLLVAAQRGLELTLKYLGTVLNDRKSYSNTRLA